MLNLLFRIIFITAFIVVIISSIKSYLPIKNDYQRLLQKDKIVIGLRTGPTSYYEVKNQKIGFTYDLINELSQYLDLTLEIKTIDNIEEATNDLNERKIDILVDVGLIERQGLIYSHRQTDYHLVYNNKYHNEQVDLDKIHEHPMSFAENFGVPHVGPASETKRNKASSDRAAVAGHLSGDLTQMETKMCANAVFMLEKEHLIFATRPVRARSWP